MLLRSIAGTALAAALVLSGCSSDDTATPDPDPSDRDAAELIQISPLTGLAMENTPDNPVFVVKIENTRNGSPQIALDDADLVVEELVEGGLTRLAAMYFSETPGKVGHVRSLRSTDIGIAAPVNGVIVATGGAGTAVRQVRQAEIPMLTEDDGSTGFSSDPAKVRPYNRLVDLKRLAGEVDPTLPDTPLLPWAGEGEASEPGTSKVTTTRSASVRFSRSTMTTWKLDGEHWVRSNGFADPEFRADNLIVMFCDVGDAGYRDPAGNPVPETRLEGTGRAVVMTGDQAVELTWKKAGLESPITFETADGEPFLLQPGRSFLELAPKGDGSISLG